MVLTIQRAENELKIGRRYFKLYPKGGHHDLALCEDAFDKVSFAAIRNLLTAEFPANVELIVDPNNDHCGHIVWLSIARLQRRIRFEIISSYHYCKWTGPGTLREHFDGMLRALKKAPGIKVEQHVDYGLSGGEEVLSMEVSADFEISGLLGNHYDVLVRKLMSVHAEVAAQAMTSMSARILAGHALPVGIGGVHRAAKPLAFICHDSRDKARVARPIAQRLTALLCPVWYDEISLRVGDRLRESIERGLQVAGKCILIISPRFLGNTGWSKTEFDSVFTRELIERKELLLPVWVGVTPKQVMAYSPALANRVGVQWSSGLDEVVRQLYLATKSTSTGKKKRRRRRS